MKYFKIRYRIGPQGDHLYPDTARGAVWQDVSYHSTDQIMVAGTEDDIVPDGQDVVQLTKKEATALKVEFRKSAPPPISGDPAMVDQ